MLASQLLQRVLGGRVRSPMTWSSSRRRASWPRWSSRRRAVVVQRGMGLNEGLEQARFDALVDEVETLVVLHGDLPNLRPDDVETLLRDAGR